jgi:hypothetical protein
MCFANAVEIYEFLMEMTTQDFLTFAPDENWKDEMWRKTEINCLPARDEN